MAVNNPFSCIVEQLAPGAALQRQWTLRGGVSARVEALELALTSGALRRVVVRQHGAAGWKPLEAGVTSTEFALLTALHRAGLPVPEPLLLDTSAQILPSPFLVLAFVEGDTQVRPEALDDALQQMASFLARLHALDLDRLALPSPLPPREDPCAGARLYLPATPAYQPLRDALARGPQRRNAPVLLHGDFWPGNLLWHQDRIAAVIDWEDAAIGDPLADLAGCRVELLWRHGPHAADTFTAAYLAHASTTTTLDCADLPLWEVFVASAGAAFMHKWGLDPALEADWRQKTAKLLARIQAQLCPSPP